MTQIQDIPEQQPQFNIYQYIQVIIRRRWLITFTAMVILMAGFLFCLFSPLVYQASTLIVTVPQKVPETYVHSTVTGSTEDRIRSILQEVTSRTYLEKLIKKFDLYPEMRNKYPMQTVVEEMKKAIQIEEAKLAGKKRDRKSRFLSFNLIYEGSNPEKVAQVANALANRFVEQNLELRTTQSENTAKFLDSQLKNIYVQLKKREEALKNYKLAHMGELPEQTAGNVATLTALQQQLQSLEENIRRAEDRAMLLRQQLADEGIAMRAAASTESKDGHATSSINALSLPEMRERLKILRSRYTARHPDVIALEKAIEEREKLSGQEKTQEKVGRLTGNPALDALKFQLKSAELDISQMKEERKHLKEQIAKYQQRIENAPKREQELIDLTRDYENLKQTYDSLLQRKLEAEQAAALERRQQGAQFRIVDPAKVPERPVKPKLKKLLPMVVVLAFGGAIGLAFALDLLSPYFYDPDDVTKAFNLPVLACIPLLLTEQEQRARRRKEMLLLGTSLAGYTVVFSLLAIILLKGPGAFSGLI